MERKLAAILAADVAGYSRLMELDEAGTFERLRTRRTELVEPAITARRGLIFKLMGDGLLAEFGSVVDAVECAVEIQRGMAERNAGLPEDHRIDLRIGVNLGEVIVEGTDRHGEGVNIAARLEQLAEPGAICVSGKVANEVEKKLAFGFESMGAQRVKNITEPIPVYRVKLDGLSAPPRRKAANSRLPAWPRLIAAATVLLAGLAAAGWYGFVRSPLHTVAASHFPAIAVLPFDDLSPDKSLGYLGDGVSEDIIAMLSRFTDSSVTARNSSFVYKGKPVDIRQVGRDLDVDYVLEGSVRKEADQTRVTAQLVNAKTGEHVWAEHYDKAGNDLSALQDEATEKIVRAITGDLGVIKKAEYHDAWAKDTASLSEYDYYLRTHDLINTAASKEAADRAARTAEEGLAKYPDSNLLTMQLAWAHFTLFWNGFSTDTAADLRKTGELTRSVLAHDNLSPQVKKLAHWLFAWVLLSEGDFPRALREADTAVAFSPYDGIMHAHLSQLLMQAGEAKKGMDWNELAHPQDPGGLQFQSYNRGLGLRLLGKYEESIAAFKQSFYPEGDTPLNVAIGLVRLGRLDEAKAEVKVALKNNPKFTGALFRSSFFYSDPSIPDREVADLAKAGLPEK
jgi:TolB-like protein/class 3 adenylate cyclase